MTNYIDLIDRLERARYETNGRPCVEAAAAIRELMGRRDDLLAALEYCKAIGDWIELHKHVNAAIASVRSSDRESNSKGGAA